MRAEGVVRRAPMRSFSQIESIVASNKNNEAFLRTMLGRTRQARGATLGKIIEDTSAIASREIARPSFHEVVSNDALIELVGSERRELIEKALSNKNIGIKEARIVFEQRIANGVRSNVAIGAEFSNNLKQDLFVPFVENGNPLVRMGSKWNRLGMWRKVGVGGKGVYNPDEYVLANLATPWSGDSRSLKQVIERSFVHGGNSPGDAADMALHPDYVAALYDPDAVLLNQKVIASPLSDHFSGKAVEDLTDAERRQYLEWAFENKLTKVGSEGTFNELTLEPRELEAMTPFGLPPSTKQSVEIRSFAKPIRLAEDSIKNRQAAALGTTFTKDYLGKERMPSFELGVGSVSPQAKEMFGQIPAEAEKAIREAYAAGSENDAFWGWAKKVLGRDIDAVKDADATLRDQWRDLFYQSPDYAAFEKERAQKAMAWMSSDYETHARKAIVKQIQKEAAATSEEMVRGGEIWQRMKQAMYADPLGVLGARRITQGLGETTAALSPELENLAVEMRRVVHVENLHVGEGPLAAGAVIGTNQLETVTGHGQATVEKIVNNGEGFDVVLRERFEEGLKFNWPQGGKGWGIKTGLSAEEHSRAVNLFNVFAEETGGGVLPAGVQAIMEGHPKYGLLDEAHKEAAALYNAAALSRELVSRKYTEKSRAMAQAFLDDLVGNHGYTWSGSQLLEKWDALPVTYAERIARRDQIARKAVSFIDTVGAEAMGDSRLAGPVLDAFRRESGLHKDAYHLSDYLFSTFRVGEASAWATSQVNAPGAVHVTYDMFGELKRMGAVETIRELQGRLEYNGDPKMAGGMFDYLKRGDFEQSIGNTISLNDIRTGVDPSKLEGRIGQSVFNPEWDRAKNNLSIDLGVTLDGIKYGEEEISLRYLPKLGTDALKGGANVHDLTWDATKLEHKLADVLSTVGGADLTKDGVAANRARRLISDYLKQLTGEMVGKQGILRTAGLDPNAAYGVWATRATSLDDARPFDVFLSRDMVERVRDPEIRKALMSEEGAFGTLFRHPVSTTPFVRARYSAEANLSPHQIGVSEKLRSMMQADDDFDPAGFLFYRKGTGAANEAEKFVLDKASTQWEYLRSSELFQNRLESSSNITGRMTRSEASSKGFRQMLEASIDYDQAAAKRMESYWARFTGRYVGNYSNAVTRMQLRMASNPNVPAGHPDYAHLKELIYNVRQVPISAQKAKMAIPGGDALAFLNRIGGAIDKGKDGAREFQSLMVNVALGTGFKSVVNDEATLAQLNKMGVTHALETDKQGFAMLDAAGNFVKKQNPLSVGDVFSVNASYAASDRGLALFENFLDHPAGQEADRLARLVTRANLSGEEALRLMHQTGSAGPEIKAVVTEGRTASSSVAEALGLGNQVLREAGSEAAKAFRPSLSILGAGLAIGAVAGLMTTTVKSGSRYRPEEQVAAADYVPGEPISGSRAASNPKRRVLSAPAQSKRIVVAPVHSSTDLEVRAKARDRASAAELAKLVERTADQGGHTNVTVNHTGGMRTRMSKLRMRETIREQMEE